MAPADMSACALFDARDARALSVGMTGLEETASLG